MQSHAEERALLQAIAAGDAKALERLFARAQTRVFRFLTRMVKNQAIAEELLNEVFLSVWQNAHRYEGRSEPMTWMLSIAHNKAISALRKRTEVLGIADEAAQDLVAEDDAPDVAVQKQDETQSVIKNGVQPSERVVTTGFVRLTEGAKVSVGDGDGPAATARPPSNGTPQAGERRRRNGSAARPNTRQ